MKIAAARRYAVHPGWRENLLAKFPGKVCETRKLRHPEDEPGGI